MAKKLLVEFVYLAKTEITEYVRKLPFTPAEKRILFRARGRK